MSYIDNLKIDGNYENNTVIRSNYVIKEYKNIANLITEITALQMLRNDHLHVPKVLNVNYQSRIVTFSRIKGRKLNNFSNNITPEFLKSFVDFLEKIHMHVSEGIGYIGQAQIMNWQFFLENKINIRLSSMNKILVNVDSIKPFLYSRLRGVQNMEKIGLLHYDLKPANILVNRRGGFVGLLDFDKAFSGDPILDYAKFSWRTLNMDEEKIEMLLQVLAPIYGNPDQLKKDIYFYVVVHCIGALSYYSDFQDDRYFKIAQNALSTLTRITDNRGIQWR
ncbi:hypothetical protein WFA24289_01867 [Periweissella fabaria]|uniref:Protein kinase domain-containing protein n=1 Tax=Periweissella fabaria TaxID=546157 RepID=A0ABN8BN62_9LACO|nr:aminoglycoside phosphotransferase family protein [Periweissella fabaria]CAH0417525.1 hypothetical protein WFA24289_01867 [Periweissella fabaria]